MTFPVKDFTSWIVFLRTVLLGICSGAHVRWKYSWNAFFFFSYCFPRFKEEVRRIITFSKFHFYVSQSRQIVGRNDKRGEGDSAETKSLETVSRVTVVRANTIMRATGQTATLVAFKSRIVCHLNGYERNFINGRSTALSFLTNFTSSLKFSESLKITKSLNFNVFIIFCTLASGFLAERGSIENAVNATHDTLLRIIAVHCRV